MKGKVLIIDDNEQNRKLERDLLKIEGYEVIEADNAAIGLGLAREQHPDLILLDVQLPGIDGIQAAKILKGDEATKAIPCIFVTAYATGEEVERIKSTGYCLGYITKPIDTRNFVKQVEEMANACRKES
jgi:CheY-like chemotaxis protein